MEERRDIVVDPMALAFAKVMTIFTVIGIVAMVVPAIFYFMGINQYIPLHVASKYWHKSAVEFWRDAMHETVHGYDWIFQNLQYTDCQSMIGVLLLMITPLLSMLAAIPKSPQKIYAILLLVASIEFIISMVVKGII